MAAPAAYDPLIDLDVARRVGEVALRSSRVIDSQPLAVPPPLGPARKCRQSSRDARGIFSFVLHSLHG